jgi:hypothetical protein
MAEHTYKLGDEVSAKTVVLGRESWDGTPVFNTGRGGWSFARDVAPWLSVEDQSALLRVVKAAENMAEGIKWFRCADCGGTGTATAYRTDPRTGEPGEPYPIQCDCGQLTDAAKAVVERIDALSPEILERVARLSEGE